jgi:hypothetical protein
MYLGDVDAKAKQQKEQLCCASCQVKKPIASFTKKERNRGAEAKCSKCSKKAQQERQKVERERAQAEREREQLDQQERSRIAALEEIAWIAANGPQIKMPTFEAPGLGTRFGEENDDYTSPEMVFHQSPTTFDSLVGSYDLIFYYTYGSADNTHANRVTKGLLAFTMDEATGKLTGSVAIDKSVKNAIWSHHYDWKITCESGASSSLLSFEVTNTDQLENFCVDEITGEVLIEGVGPKKR